MGSVRRVTKSNSTNYKVTNNTTKSGLKSLRPLTEKPRSVRLYADQEERLLNIIEQLGRNVSYQDVLRDGMDLVLDDIEKRFKIKPPKKKKKTK